MEILQGIDDMMRDSNRPAILYRIPDFWKGCKRVGKCDKIPGSGIPVGNPRCNSFNIGTPGKQGPECKSFRSAGNKKFNRIQPFIDLIDIGERTGEITG